MRFLVVASLMLVASAAAAYEIGPGDLVGRAVLGATVNAARYEAASRATPSGGLLVGTSLEMALNHNLGLELGFSGAFAPGFADQRLLAGVRARVRTVDATVHPYAAIAMTTAVGLPLGHGEAHWNLGVRGALGVEYFLTRRFAVGLEAGAEPSILVFPEPALEFSVEGLISLAWRF